MAAPPAPTPHLDGAEHLLPLARSLADAAHPAGSPAVDAHQPLLLGVTLPGPAPDGELELWARAVPVGPRGATDAVLGFRAPPWWDVAGMVVAGHARSLDGGPDLGEVTVGVLVDRAGATASWAIARGEAVAPPLGRPAGAVVDAVHRVLGVPTAPPEVPLEEWLGQRWLDQLLQRPGGLTPERAAAAHPAAAEVDHPPPGPDALAELTRRLVAGWSWEGLRLACADALVHLEDLLPHEAAWMDAGAFARWVVGCRPRTEELLDQLAVEAPPATHRFVAATLRATAARARPG